MVPRWFRLTVCLAFALAVALGGGFRAAAQQGPAALTALGLKVGPIQGDLGGLATVDVPEGYGFVPKGGASRFMEMLQNPSDGSELGVVLAPTKEWFVVFTFSNDGYIKDDDRTLDAKAILASIKEGTAQANKLRRERGWSTLEIVGWQKPPYYDQSTNNLTWSIKGRSDNGESINHSTRLLGRRGVMNVDLVLDPDALTTAMPAFTTLLSSFSFKPGHRYSEFTTGDKVAEYGLAGLVLGGAGVALVKTGLLQKLWKVIVIAFLALVGAIKKFFGGRPAAPTAPPTGHRPPPPGYRPPPPRRPANV